MSKFLATGIQYETDGYKVDLPSTLVVECDDEELVVDTISDMTGWLVTTVGSITEL